MHNPLKRKKSIYEQQLDPETLNTNPMVKEGQLGAVIALPLLGFLFGIIFYAKNYAITQEEFTLFSIVGLVVWMVGLFGYWAYALGQAARYKLFDREFGYSERLHPRCECYCKPEDVRLLIGKGDKIENFAGLKERVLKLGIDEKATEKILKTLEDINKKGFSKNLYYFRHKDAFEGWNTQEHTMPTFKSHVVFTNEAFDKQFGFSAGQENWFGPILYNHPSAESDNIQILGWSRDPFSGEHMPWGNLIHCSKNYKIEQQATDNPEIQLKELEAATYIIASQHALNESFRKSNTQLGALVEGKLRKDEFEPIKLGHEVARVDWRYMTEVMRDVTTGFWSRLGAIGKVIVTIAMIAGIVMIVWLVLAWLGYAVLPWTGA